MSRFLQDHKFECDYVEINAKLSSGEFYSDTFTDVTLQIGNEGYVIFPHDDNSRMIGINAKEVFLLDISMKEKE